MESLTGRRRRLGLPRGALASTSESDEEGTLSLSTSSISLRMPWTSLAAAASLAALCSFSLIDTLTLRDVAALTADTFRDVSESYKSRVRTSSVELHSGSVDIVSAPGSRTDEAEAMVTSPLESRGAEDVEDLAPEEVDGLGDVGVEAVAGPSARSLLTVTGGGR